MSYFDKGGKPKIAVINKSAVSFGNILEIVEALNKFVEVHFAPVWGTPADIVFSQTVPPGHWVLVFLDDADSSYNEITSDDLPVGKVFVKTVLANKSSITVAASHELAEMLVDPAINLCAMKCSNGIAYALEVSDPVEETEFKVNGYNMTNFVYPAWFESYRRPGSAKFDHLGLIDRPFKLLKGGCASIIKPKGTWTQIYGSKAKAEIMKKKDQRGKRNVRRMKGIEAKKPWWKSLLGL